MTLVSTLCRVQESCDGTTTGGVLDIDVKLFRGEASNLETLGGSHWLGRGLEFNGWFVLPAV